MAPWWIDLHVHGELSPDSAAKFGEYAERMGSVGLQGIALTDHNAAVRPSLLVRLRERFPDHLFLPGVEVSAKEGHVLVFGVDSAPPRHIALDELVEWTRARNGVTALAHPLRTFHGVGRRVAMRAAVDALEVRNGRTGVRSNLRVERIAASRGLAMVGGSDAHEVESLGRSFTELEEVPEGPDDVLEAIRRRRTRAHGNHLSASGRASVGMRNLRLRAGRRFRSV